MQVQMWIGIAKFSALYVQEMITTRDQFLQIFVFCSDGLAPQVLMPPGLQWPSEHLMYNMLTTNIIVPTSSRGCWTQRMFLS
ncbi:unnamed protein product [Sphagnum jensenii]|uniref:Uncharacterized protein n=1 Tax=Sphagnum jensenii TaxID=128206 RepID=A0ABP0VYP4_9BRYO